MRVYTHKHNINIVSGKLIFPQRNDIDNTAYKCVEHFAGIKIDFHQTHTFFHTVKKIKTKTAIIPRKKRSEKLWFNS